jgi:hypothetical protein
MNVSVSIWPMLHAPAIPETLGVCGGSTLPAVGPSSVAKMAQLRLALVSTAPA